MIECIGGSLVWYRDEIPEKAIIGNAIAPDPRTNPDWRALETASVNRLPPSANVLAPFVEDHARLWHRDQGDVL
jgi:hypothetical protein